VCNSASNNTEKRNNFADYCIIGTLENKIDVVAINLKNVEYITYLDDARSQFHFISGNSIVVLRKTIITSDGPMRKQINY
jgi:hypothetical protein